MLFSKFLLLIVCCFLIIGTNAHINTFRIQQGVYSECLKNGDIAITFDDGTSSNTEAVLDVLKEKGVRATFFVNGINFENINDQTAQDKLKRIIREVILHLVQLFNKTNKNVVTFKGHQIGSHTWSHIDLTANQSLETIRSEMLDLENKVEEILGFKMAIMRPPYGRLNDSVLDIIHGEMNYSVIMWNLDTADWANGADTNVSFQAYVDAMEFATNLNSSFIALHHDFADGSATLARQAIDYALGRGFNPVRISECIGIPDSSGVNCSTTCTSLFFIFLCFLCVMKM